jgi:hypothetical protein
LPIIAIASNNAFLDARGGYVFVGSGDFGSEAIGGPQGDGRITLRGISEDDDHPLAQVKCWIASSDAANFNGGIRTYRARGTLPSPSVVGNADLLCSWDVRGYSQAGAGPEADGYVVRGFMSFKTTEAWSGTTANGTSWGVSITPVGSGTMADALILDGSGLRLPRGTLGLPTVQPYIGLNISSLVPLTGNVSQRGIFCAATGDSGATTSIRGIEVQALTAAAAFTCVSAYGVLINSMGKGAGSTVTTNYGLYVDNQTAGVTNYAIYTNAGFVRFGGSIIMASGTNISLFGSQILAARKTGWSTATGTKTRTTFVTDSVTLPELAARVGALIDDLHNTAGHGLIGT